MSLSVTPISIKQTASSNLNGHSLQGKSINSQLEKAGFNPYYAKKAAGLSSVQLKNALALKSAGFEDSYAVENSSMSSEQLAVVIKAKQTGFKDYFAIKCTELSSEQLQNALRLKDSGFNDMEAVENAKMPVEQVTNSVLLKTAGFESNYSILGAKKLDSNSVKNAIKLKNAGLSASFSVNNAAEFSSEQITNVIRLKQAGFTDFYSTQGASLTPLQIENAIKLKNLGYKDEKAVKDAAELSESQINNFIKYVNSGFNYEDSQNIALNPESQEKFEELTYQGYDGQIASIMANVNGAENYDNDELYSFLTSIRANNPTEDRVSQVVSKYLKDNPEVNLVEFTDYINDIDFEEISEIAPSVKKFGAKEYLKFAFYHYRAGTTEFTKDVLSVDDDFTQYLTENYIDADMLTDLLTAFPATPREVGSIPEGWFDNIPADEHSQKIQEIYDAVSRFQETTDTEEFEKQISSVLGKKAVVSELSTGTFGTGYRISTENAKDLCLKIFPKDLEKRNKTPNMHGQHVEVQNAIFANKHSSDFVKMYFGRVAAHKQKDGFLVTQYLGQNIIPVITGKVPSEYKVTSGDCFMGHNMINGKNIDFGGMIVEKNGERLTKWV